MTVNAGKLHAELAAKGLPVSSVSGNGEIEYTRIVTTTEQAIAAATLAAHDPVEYAITPGLQVIRGNGEHEAVVEVRAAGSEVYLLVNDLPTALPLVSGTGVLHMVSDTPGAEIVVKGASGGLAACAATIYVV